MDTKNFSQFLADVVARQARQSDSSFSYPIGTAFLDELYFSGRELLANAFIVMRCDPMGKDSVPTEALAFVERNW